MNVSVVDCVVDFEEFDAHCAVLACIDSTRVDIDCPEKRVEFTACIDVNQHDYAKYIASVDRAQFRDSPFATPEQTVVVTLPCFPVQEKVYSPVVEIADRDKINKSLILPRKRLVPAEERERVPDTASVTLLRKLLAPAESVTCQVDPPVYIPVRGVPNTPDGKFSMLQFCREMLDSIPLRKKAAEKQPIM